MQEYIDLLTKIKEASGISKLFQRSPNLNLARLITMGQRRKKLKKMKVKKTNN